MASVTAFFLVGSTHPYDGGLDPLFVVKLFEGDRALWQATSLADSEEVIEMDPTGSTSNEIFETGCRLVELLAHNFQTDAAGLVVFQGSIIEAPSNDAEKDLKIKLLFTTKV